MASVTPWNIEHEGGVLIKPGNSSMPIGVNTDWAYPSLEYHNMDPLESLARTYYTEAAITNSEAQRAFSPAVGSLPVLTNVQKDPLLSIAGGYAGFLGIHGEEEAEGHREDWVNMIALGSGPVVSQAGAVVPRDRYQDKIGASWFLRPWGVGGSKRMASVASYDEPSIVEARESASRIMSALYGSGGGNGGRDELALAGCQCVEKGSCCGK